MLLPSRSRVGGSPRHPRRPSSSVVEGGFQGAPHTCSQCAVGMAAIRRIVSAVVRPAAVAVARPLAVQPMQMAVRGLAEAVVQVRREPARPRSSPVGPKRPSWCTRG
jgi:hypothetical protein